MRDAEFHPRCRMQKRNAGFGRREERRVGDGTREQNRVGRMAKPVPDAAFISPLPTLPLKGAGFARWPLAGRKSLVVGF
jgi:hypothetical protein